MTQEERLAIRQIVAQYVEQVQRSACYDDSYRDSLHIAFRYLRSQLCAGKSLDAVLSRLALLAFSYSLA